MLQTRSFVPSGVSASGRTGPLSNSRKEVCARAGAARARRRPDTVAAQRKTRIDVTTPKGRRQARVPSPTRKCSPPSLPPDLARWGGESGRGHQPRPSRAKRATASVGPLGTSITTTILRAVKECARRLAEGQAGRFSSLGGKSWELGKPLSYDVELAFRRAGGLRRRPGEISHEVQNLRRSAEVGIEYATASV